MNNMISWDSYSDWPDLPCLRPAGDLPASSVRRLGDSFAGSWSVPLWSRLRALYGFVRKRLGLDLPLDEKANWRMRWVAFVTIPLTLMRPAEFNHWSPSPQSRVCRSRAIVHAAKQKDEERETWVMKELPVFLHETWWACVEECARDHVSGPLWCLRDETGGRRLFDLQGELDDVVAAMGLGPAYIRDYGLRHLGRTEHRLAGMPEAWLNYKMNHYGVGYERFNPFRKLDYRGYDQTNERVMLAVAERLGIFG